MVDLIIDMAYTPRPLQAEIHVASATHRFMVLNVHRRWGKTVMAINDILDHLLFLEYRQPQGVYIAPTYGQAKRVAWDYFKLFTRMIPGVEYKEGELLLIIPRPHKNDVVKIWLLGAENPDSIRGMYLDYGIFDEYASMNPIVWSKVVRPALSDRKGKATFIGTPQGENHFYDIYKQAEELGTTNGWYARSITVEDSKYVDEKELESARKTMTADEYAQEFMVSFSAALTGAYYSKYLETAMEEGRIADVPHDPNMPVSTFWDLGISDAMAIWFIQKKGEMFHVIDYMENVGKGVEHYIQELYKKPYTYAKHYVPHDSKKRELGTGRTVVDSMEALGLRPLFTVPRVVAKKDEINAVRMVLPMCRFDRMKTGDGLRALKNFQAEWDAKDKRFKDSPKHDWCSHASDAMGCFARGREESSFVPSHTLIGKVPTKAITDYDEFSY
jgi:phage terminase large subunit